ncbi:DUF4387 domain-containing protein [uncultured Porphyromonas sp.]|uniref:DUF4387 domain-containing protein n=1 Tax=uncultured Porphyromonas sp. TaxID=159274 RepID=UPI0025968C2C|nr:DUF4387 domain-containing protein [uncultured Porphyromonas sp.]
MQTYKLVDMASVIRSKNSGPYELTFDIIFKTFDDYNFFKKYEPINKSSFAKLYGIAEEDVLQVIYFDPAKAVKATIKRPIPSGALGETDVYGAQQHAPLMKFTFDA